MTPREMQKIVLEGMDENELLQEYQKVFGKDAMWAKRIKAIESILDEQFGAKKQAEISLPCPRCNCTTPHRTPAILRDDEGKKVQQMQCAICNTLTIVPTGEHGEVFQQNVDEPDNTDFSGLDT